MVGSVVVLYFFKGKLINQRNALILFDDCSEDKIAVRVLETGERLNFNKSEIDDQWWLYGLRADTSVGTCMLRLSGD